LLIPTSFCECTFARAIDSYSFTKIEEARLWFFSRCILTCRVFSVETALAPAAADGLGWGPIETSSVLGSSSIVIGAAMVFVMVITKYISDLFLQGIGAIFWFVGGFGIYFGWTRGGPVWHYVIPVMVCVTGFPFIAASNRSSFSKSVASKPELEGIQASMQAVLSMAASVAGFV
jgi:hypothetical protein